MIKSEYPLISIVITTFNSARTIKDTLSSIRQQTYPQNQIEILIIDGGSNDNTKLIAQDYNCRIIKKPNTEMVYRKQLGFIKASGKYLIFLDSDESFENKESLKLKYSIFLRNNLVKSVISQGSKSPKHSSFINDYINEFGDPFSFYLYRETKGDKFLIKEWKKKYKVLKETGEYIIFDLNPTSSLIELWAGGCMFDLGYAKSNFPQIKKELGLLALLFYLLKTRGKLLAITKNDAIIHDSSTTFYKYLKKISSRIKNNVFQTGMGRGGYSGREEFQSYYYHIKKFFFPLYTYSLVLPLLDSIYMSIYTKKLSYLIHFPLCIYTATVIVYFITLKIMGIRPKIGMYGS